MADHAEHGDQNSEATESQSLDQSAIDAAFAAAQIDNSEDAQAKAGGSSGAGDPKTDESAATPEANTDSEDAETHLASTTHANGGDTFGESAGDGHAELDAAIAAIQADVSKDDQTAAVEATVSENDGQEDIDVAISAMQAGGSDDAQAAADIESESENYGQDDIDATITAMQATASDDAAAATEEATESENYGQEDIDAAIAGMQTGDVDDDHTGEDQEADRDDEARDDFDATISDMSAGVSEDVAVAGDGNSAGADAEIETVDDGSMASEIENADPDEIPDGTEQEEHDSVAAEGEGGMNATEEIAATSDSSNDPDTTDPPDTVTEPIEIPQGELDPGLNFDAGNTFSNLEEDELEDRESSEPGGAVEGLAKSDPTFGDEADFKGLDDEDSEVTAVVTGKDSAAIDSASENYTDALAEEKKGAQVVSNQKKAVSKVSDSSSVASGAKKKKLAIAVVCLAVLIGLAAFFGRDHYSKYVFKSTDQSSTVSENPSMPAKPVSAPTPIAVKTEDAYSQKLSEVARLRADLLSKKDEIDQLKQFYRDGISELEEELQQEATKHNIQKLSEALANQKIKLDLQSIQRRRAYIDELEKPSHWLHQASEELLFLSRRTEIDLQMNNIAAGIELTKHMRRLNASLQKYQLAPDRLAIDVNKSRLRPIEEIWQAIEIRNKTIAQRAVANGDQAIIDEICNGNTGRIAELSTLTIKASKCLAQIGASELFLNRLTSISPVAAKYLSNWKGQWLCLNGFRELTPEVARHLFRWEGNWISLNGLRDFPPQLGELLLSWEGHQLELMGLGYHPDRSEQIGLQQLAHWEKAGGKLFVPAQIRTEIVKLK